MKKIVLCLTCLYFYSFLVLPSLHTMGVTSTLSALDSLSTFGTLPITAIALAASSADPCDEPEELLLSQGQGTGFEPALHVDVEYPKQAKVQEEVRITALVTPRSFPTENPMSLQITCQGCPQAEYSIRKGFPTSRVTFNKAGTYTLNISTGLLMSAG